MSEQKLKLNLNAPSWLPKSKKIQPQEPSPQPSLPHTSLSLNAKVFIPKSKIKNMSQTPLQSEPKPKPKKVYKEYFVIDEDDKQIFNFDYDYMISFENWEICQETKLLSEEFLKHLEDFKIVESEPIKQNNQNNKGKKKYHGDRRNKDGDKKKEVKELSDFGRKDYSKEISLAEQFKKR